MPSTSTSSPSAKGTPRSTQTEARKERVTWSNPSLSKTHSPAAATTSIALPEVKAGCSAPTGVRRSTGRTKRDLSSSSATSWSLAPQRKSLSMLIGPGQREGTCGKESRGMVNAPRPSTSGTRRGPSGRGRLSLRCPRICTQTLRPMGRQAPSTRSLRSIGSLGSLGTLRPPSLARPHRRLPPTRS